MSLERPQVGWHSWLRWVSASTVGFATFEAVRPGLGVSIILLIVALYGAITGAALLRLLRQPRPGL